MPSSLEQRSGKESLEMQQSDEQLLREYRDEGSRAAFDTLFHRYERELYSYLRRYLGDASMAEDVFQQTFLQVHLKCGQFDAERKFRPWLYTVATNQAIDAQRKNRRHRMPSLEKHIDRDGIEGGTLADLALRRDDAGVHDVDERDEQEVRLREVVPILERLREDRRQVFFCVVYNGMKYREAASMLGIPIGTVKSRLHAAMEEIQSWARLVLRRKENRESDQLSMRSVA